MTTATLMMKFGEWSPARRGVMENTTPRTRWATLVVEMVLMGLHVAFHGRRERARSILRVRSVGLKKASFYDLRVFGSFLRV